LEIRPKVLLVRETGCTRQVILVVLADRTLHWLPPALMESLERFEVKPVPVMFRV
jgi:hypothetical protein